jgi:hypothetical protein
MGNGVAQASVLGVVLFLKRGKGCPQTFPVQKKVEPMKKRKGLRLLAVIGTVLGFSSALGNAQIVATFDDIVLWTGTGANRAGLVIDFHDGQAKQSFVWGFRWDGEATGSEMITAIAAADTNLSIQNGGTVGSGFFLTQASYFDGVFNHIATSGDFVSNFAYWGYFVVGGTAGGTFAPDVFDPVTPGASTGFPAPWAESPAGASAISLGSPGRFLANNAWDAWSFGEFGTLPSTEAYAAIPEPGSATLAILGFFLLCHARKRLHTC